jgi:F0F1-type ATP synthase assembly protein I
LNISPAGFGLSRSIGARGRIGTISNNADSAYYTVRYCHITESDMEATASAWMRIAIEIVACVIMVGGVLGVFIERFRTRRGIGVRVIQFLAITLVLPSILILSLEDVLSGQTTATLIGVIVGYILSGTGRDESNKAGQ